MDKKILPLLSILLLSAKPAYALRCGNHLVVEGDHRSAVLQKCGDPIALEERDEVAPDPNCIHGGLSRQYCGQSRIVVHVEEWTYNFGPQRFMQLLRFENGILRKISDLGRGF